MNDVLNTCIDTLSCVTSARQNACGGSYNPADPCADVSGGWYAPLNSQVKGATSQSGPQATNPLCMNCIAPAAVVDGGIRLCAACEEKLIAMLFPEQSGA